MGIGYSPGLLKPRLDSCQKILLYVCDLSPVTCDLPYSLVK
jgi:hypothetical protein